MEKTSGDIVDDDVKPIIIPSTGVKSKSVEVGLTPNLVSGPKKWSPGSWQDANRKSAFLPYKPLHCTVLTNLQRGNTQAETPVPQASDFSFHSRAGQGEITEIDIKYQSSLDAIDSNGFTALHWAAAYGQLTSIELLIAGGASVDKLGPEGETALLLAASGGHHDVIRFLLNSGANVNHVDHVCNTALMYAAKGNHPHCCNELLLRDADVTMVNLNDDTAFTLAVDNKSNLAQAVIENHLLTFLGS